MTRIVPSPKSETKFFGNEPIHEFWLESPASAPSVNNNNDYMNRLKNCLESAPKDGVICVFSEELSSKTLCESIAKARDNGNRIYILTNNYHNEMRNLEGCLIRYGGGKRIGSFILINPNTMPSGGCLFTGMFSDGSVNLSAHLLLDLDTEQVSVLFRYFCYQFWNKAEKERIGREERNTGSAPVDIFPPVGDSCDFEYLKTVWGKAEKGVITASLLAETPYIKFSNFSNSTIVSLFTGGIDNSLVRLLKQKQNEIYVHDDVGLINSIKTPDGTWLIPTIDIDRKEEVYALLLNAGQTNILYKTHINTVLQGKVRYGYYESSTREKISGKTIFRLGDSPSQKYRIPAESEITAESVPPTELLPKDEFENLKPELIDDGRSVSIKYKWTNTPFTLPSGSKKHQLYQNWENAEKSIRAYIEQIRGDIADNENKGNKLSKLVARLFLSKQQKFSEYRNDLDMLYNIKYCGISEQELQDKIKEINEIRSAVKKDSNEISEKEREARLNEQIEAEEEKKKKLENELGDKQQVLKKIEEDVKIHSESLKKLEKQGEEKKEEIKQARKKSDDLNTGRNKTKNDIKSLESQIDDQPKKKEKLEADLADKRRNLQKTEEDMEIQAGILKELEKQGEKKEAIKEAKKKSDALDATINKTKDDIKSLESQIEDQLKKKEKLEADLADKRRNLQKTEEDMEIQADILKELEKQGEEKKEEIKQARKKSEDSTVGNNKIKNEIDGLERDIKRSKIEIERLRDDLKKPIESQKNESVLLARQGGGKKSNQSGQTGELAVPQFPRLPSVGDLYKHNEQDYLAITNWEEYDQGKEEAKRLKAKLCALP